MSLTSYPPGSLRELLKISIPLMASSLTTVAMLFVDRLFLAQYSIDAHNGAVNGATLGWACMMGWVGVTGIAEVFVAQYNGAKAYEKMGNPVWQMIWLSLISSLFFFPLSWWGTEWIYGQSAAMTLTKEYFRFMVLFGPAYCLYAAVGAFFIGRGETLIITVLAVAANILNAFLDWLLIFGIEDWIPAMGVRGAVIATNIGICFQFLILFALFLRPKYRREFGTTVQGISWEKMRRCIRIGLPGSVASVIEICGYATFYALMTQIGDAYITVAGIFQNFLILFFFIPEGLNKAAVTVSGNLIGARRHDLVSQVVRNGTVLLLWFLAGLTLLFFLFKNILLGAFTHKISAELLGEILPALQFTLLFVALTVFLEGTRSLLVGVLTAAGDTRFIMWAGSTMIWLFLITPIYVFMIWQTAPVILGPIIGVFNAFMVSLIYAWRFVGGRWRSLQIEEITAPSLSQSQ